RRAMPFEDGPAKIRPVDVGGRHGAVAAEISDERFCVPKVPARNGERSAPSRQSAGHLGAKDPVTAEDHDTRQEVLPTGSREWATRRTQTQKSPIVGSVAHAACAGTPVKPAAANSRPKPATAYPIAIVNRTRPCQPRKASVSIRMAMEYAPLAITRLAIPVTRSVVRNRASGGGCGQASM